MRLKTPITAENLRNHFTYGLWKYVLLAVFAVFGWNLLYSVTAYHSPQEKRIDVYVQTSTTSSAIIDAFLEPIWKATVPDMETVSSVVLMDASQDSSLEMQLFTYFAAGEGDIYILNEDTYKQYAAQGIFIPLDELIKNGTINVDGVDLSKGYIAYVDEYDENGMPVSSSLKLFGIPLESYYGFMNEIRLDNRRKYAVITVNNKNDENVIPFFNALLQAGRGEMPEWLSAPAAETP